MNGQFRAFSNHWLTRAGNFFLGAFVVITVLAIFFLIGGVESEAEIYAVGAVGVSALATFATLMATSIARTQLDTAVAPSAPTLDVDVQLHLSASRAAIQSPGFEVTLRNEGEGPARYLACWAAVGEDFQDFTAETMHPKASWVRLPASVPSRLASREGHTLRFTPSSESSFRCGHICLDVAVQYEDQWRNAYTAVWRFTLATRDAAQTAGNPMQVTDELLLRAMAVSRTSSDPYTPVFVPSGAVLYRLSRAPHFIPRH